MIIKKAFLPMVLATGLLLGACKQELHPSDQGNLVPETVDQNPDLPGIFLNGTRLHAETFGHPDSAIIIVVHSGPGGDYRPLLRCKALADDGYFVVFYDQRGSGLSQRHPKEDFSIQIMFDDLSAIIQHYRTRPGQKVFLFGQSWGAMLATAYINEYPEQISGAVLSEPGGFTWEDTRAFLEKSRAAQAFSEDRNDVFYFDQIFTGKADDHEILDYKMQLAAGFETVDGNMLGNAGAYPFWRKGAVASSALLEIAEKQGFDWTNNLHLFDTKVLFLYSAWNEAYGLQHAQHVSSAFPNVQLEKIDGSGHELPYFGWDKVYPLARTYFNTLK